MPKLLSKTKVRLRRTRRALFFRNGFICGKDRAVLWLARLAPVLWGLICVGMAAESTLQHEGESLDTILAMSLILSLIPLAIVSFINRTADGPLSKEVSLKIFEGGISTCFAAIFLMAVGYKVDNFSTSVTNIFITLTFTIGLMKYTSAAWEFFHPLEGTPHHQPFTPKEDKHRPADADI